MSGPLVGDLKAWLGKEASLTLTAGITMYSTNVTRWEAGAFASVDRLVQRLEPLPPNFSFGINKFDREPGVDGLLYAIPQLTVLFQRREKWWTHKFTRDDFYEDTGDLKRPEDIQTALVKHVVYALRRHNLIGHPR